MIQLLPSARLVILTRPTSSADVLLWMSTQETRDEVKAEVMKAPKRRVDNMITRLTDSLHLLQVHTRVSIAFLGGGWACVSYVKLVPVYVQSIWAVPWCMFFQPTSCSRQRQRGIDT